MSSPQAEIGMALERAGELPGWGAFIRPYLDGALVSALGKRYGAGRCHPSPSRWFRALEEVGPPSSVRVVILGQDPYHGPGQADGLAFSVPAGQSLPPSLRNIYREIAGTCGGTPAVHGDLSHWAGQGVLLLNDVLSVGEGEARSHADIGWQPVTAAILSALVVRPATFLLWGRHAAGHAARIGGLRPDHCVLEAPHPSPLSAHRGFIGCGHFSAVNAWLTQRNEEPIRWWPSWPG